MDYSKYLQRIAEASNTYKSYWQPRDASEITALKGAKAAKDNSTTHVGPTPTCYGNLDVPSTQAYPNNGFSTDYSYDIVRSRQAGCVACNDETVGKEGGITLKSFAEVSTILADVPNPVKGATQNCCASSEVVQRGNNPPCCSDGTKNTHFP